MKSPLLHIEILKGSLLNADAQVIVNMANSHGVMGGGVGGAMRWAAWVKMEREAIRLASIPVDSAILISGGKTGFRGFIHAPTMPEPAMRIPVGNLSQATRAALVLAEVNKFRP